MKLTQLTAEQKTTYVGLLTELQKDELIGQLYAPDSYYNPIQDLNDNWVISIEEIEQTVTPEFLWVKDLEMIPYEPKPTPPPFELI
jgi:predicted DNA-binding transcriptional regulator